MNELSKREEVASLYEIYKSLLSDSQKEVIEDYYIYDLSLAEIASNRSSSRAAVEDALKKGEKKLRQYEEKLSIFSTRKTLKAKLEEAKKNNDYKDLEDYINGI